VSRAVSSRRYDAIYMFDHRLRRFKRRDDVDGLSGEVHIVSESLLYMSFTVFERLDIQAGGSKPWSG